MYFPCAREHVRVAGRPGVYLVGWVDQDLQSADLIALDDNTSMLEGVPFDLLRPEWEEVEIVTH
jgi:hypothetical protein